MENSFVNCKNFNVAFAVPNLLVDDYIDSLSLLQIKVFLYILRHSGETKAFDEMANTIKSSPCEIKNSIDFLKNIGLLKNETDERKKLKVNSSQKKSIYETEFKYQKPNPSFVVERMTGSKEIAFLMQEAQVILGRPLSNIDSATLIMFHDTDGLPVGVILMLLQYTVSIGKKSMKYIEKVAASWGTEGIDSIKKAEKKIKSLQDSNEAWGKIRALLQLENRAPTAREMECCNNWVNNLKVPLDLIKEAYDVCINLKGKYAVGYIDAILKDWSNKKIRTVSELKKYKKIPDVSNKKNNKSASSYNIDNYLSDMDSFA